MENKTCFSNEEANSEKKSVYEHFYDIKTLVFHIVLAFIVVFFACCYFANDAMSLMQNHFLPDGQTLHYFSIMEPFILKVKIGFAWALVVSTPFILMRVAFYLVEAVQKKSQLFLYTALGCALFFVGIAFAFRFFIPLVVKIMFVSGSVDANFILHADKFFSMVFVLLFACGVVLEIPLATVGLLQCGLITVPMLKKFRKFHIILSFVAGAVFTPPDVFSQIIVAMLMIALFEVTIFCFSICKGIKE